MNGPTLCIVLAVLCALIGLIEYLRPRATTPNYWYGPVFWPVLGFLIIEICKLGGGSH